jgi:formamidopyrimidine-DNA glycosylase
MPELPEVEHIVRYLRGRIAGKKIRGVVVRDASARRRPTALPLRGAVRAISRRGKLVLIDLDAKGTTLVFHLKLTGRLLVLAKGDEPSRWTRLSVDLGPVRLHFEDTRRLGWFDVVDAKTRRALEDAIGPEPLEPGFTLAVFEERRARRRGPVKPVLLDPAFVAGIGNIYADEILHDAGIHPLERIETLDEASLARLHRAIVSVLARAVAERSGVPGQDRVGGGSKTASRELVLAVFQRTGEPCPRCATVIERLVVRGRGTHVCPRCQPLHLAPSSRKGGKWSTRSTRSGSARTRRRSSSTRRS